jgi:succinate dehydrogenase flavin-adding protein (antitoxin of CptAB toxin-antitoxin module)
MIDIYNKKVNMKFGLLKTKIEHILNESYGNDSFKDEIKKFNQYVLGNRNIAKLFYLYDELSSNKGLNEHVANDFIHESITFYENTINKIEDKDILTIKKWVNHVNVTNNYDMIDNLFNGSVLNIEGRIVAKNMIRESLTKPGEVEKQVINLPISTMVNIANKTIAKYYEGLNESDKKEFNLIFESSDEDLKVKFEPLKEGILTKLNTIKENSEGDMIDTINESIEKVKSEEYSKITYFKLKNLSEEI